MEIMVIKQWPHMKNNTKGFWLKMADWIYKFTHTSFKNSNKTQNGFLKEGINLKGQKNRWLNLEDGV